MNNEPFTKLNDVVLLTLVIYGEARNQGLDGMLAVGAVVLNRVKRQSWYGKSLSEVILKPSQFSCFNADDPNLYFLLAMAVDFKSYWDKDLAVKTAGWISTGILGGYLQDNVSGATHYHRADCYPAWDDDPKKMELICTIKDHVFYKEV